MAANTTILNGAVKSEVLRVIEIVSLGDLTYPGYDNPGEYVYGAYTFYSPEVSPAAGDYLVLNSAGKNGLMPAATFTSNYVSLGTGADGITAITDNSGGTATNTIAAATNTSALTDSSGGTANTTIAAITQAANAGSADVGPTADAIADLAAQLAVQRTLNTVLINAVASLAAKVNTLISNG